MSTTTNRPPPLSDSDLAAIRAAITTRREAAGLSPESLSQAAGLSPAVVRRIESGRTAPALGTLYALARALECPAAALVPGPGK